jgi:hypothetical protein
MTSSGPWAGNKGHAQPKTTLPFHIDREQVGLDVIATHSSRPRKLESPICAANAAKTRPETRYRHRLRDCQICIRFIHDTMTGPRARMVIRIRICCRSVSPTHFERNSPISITGRPHSLAKTIDQE